LGRKYLVDAPGRARGAAQQCERGDHIADRRTDIRDARRVPGQAERLGRRPDAERVDRAADEHGIGEAAGEQTEGDQTLHDRAANGEPRRAPGGHVTPELDPLVDNRCRDLVVDAELVREHLSVHETWLPFERGVDRPHQAERDPHDGGERDERS
jgi:hypothetical protein